MKKNIIPLISIGASLALLSGCVTKGAKTVYARPVYVNPPITAKKAELVELAPRNQPGKLMDPDAITFAQVPNRIVYLPGGGTAYTRTSATQIVNYDLVPVGRIPEIQAQATPVFESRVPKTSEKRQIRDIFPAQFPNLDGGVSKGIARRLGVIGDSPVEKTRAKGLLKDNEVLRWDPNVGWVGFVEETIIRPEQKKPKPELPDLGTKKEETQKEKEGAKLEPISGGSLHNNGAGSSSPTSSTSSSSTSTQSSTEPQKKNNNKKGTGVDID
jgi:hypothetical protein